MESLTTKLTFGDFTANLYSKKLTPLMNDLVNRAMNADWRFLFCQVEKDFEIYAAYLIRSFVELVVGQVAIQDFYLC